MIVIVSGLSIVGCDQGTLDVEEGTNKSFTWNQTTYTVYDNNGNYLCYINYCPNSLCGLLIYFDALAYNYTCFYNSYPTMIKSYPRAGMIIWDFHRASAICSLRLVGTWKSLYLTVIHLLSQFIYLLLYLS